MFEVCNPFSYPNFLFVMISFQELFLMNKLAFLNLSHNLIVDLKELYSLKNLFCLTQVISLKLK